MTTQDPYEWAKRRIGYLLDAIKPIRGEDGSISPGDIWSIKKILVLDYYLAASHDIFKNYFDEWYYVDTHCGSGMFKIRQDNDNNGMLFPGSPLAAMLRPDNKRCTKYFLYDYDDKAIDALQGRLEGMGTRIDRSLYETAVSDFASTSMQVKKMERRGRAFVVNVDPAGFKHLAWSDLERILSVGKADVFVTLMSYTIGMGRTQAQDINGEMAATFDRVFGTNEWRECHNNDDLVDLYIRRIKTMKKYVEKIPVRTTQGSVIYQLIFASDSSGGAGKIIDYTKKIADKVTTDMVAGAVGVATHKTSDLDRWLPGKDKGMA